MIHYLGYSADGQFQSIELMPSGWPDEFDLESPNPTHELAVYLKNTRASHDPPVVGFVTWDCGHEIDYDFHGQIHPACYQMHGCYYDIDGTSTETIIPKPPCALIIDDEQKLVLDGTCIAASPPPMVDIQPGEVMTLGFTGTIPDGVVIKVNAGNSIVDVMGVPEVELTFENGVTDLVEIVGPPTGLKALISITGKFTCNVSFLLRGWPST